MELSMLLAQLFGVYLVVTGVSVLARRKMILYVVRDMAKNAALVYFVGAVELILGLLVILTHNVWVTSWEVVITIFGWLMALEGASYILLPQDFVKKVVKVFGKQSYLTVGGFGMLLLGAYLLYIGFLA